MKNISKINEGTMWGKSFERGMGKGIRKEDDPTDKIIDFMDKNMIPDYKINDDYSVDVDNDVVLIGEECKDGRIPFRFNKVSGYFDCSICHLVSLEGCPREVGGNFDCYDNKLESLEGCPEKVGGFFQCSSNNKKFTEEYVRSLCDVKRKIYC